MKINLQIKRRNMIIKWAFKVRDTSSPFSILMGEYNGLTLVFQLDIGSID
jgi:hypothetical protein